MSPRSAAGTSLLPANSQFRSHERVSHSVHFWPATADDHRWLLHVASDVDHCRFRTAPLPTTTSLCIHAARSGARVRNLIVRGAWLVFEPEDGPGEYELYTSCAPAEANDLPEAAWRLTASRGLSSDPHAFASALLTTREARATALGPPWRDQLEDQFHWGAHRTSVGNMRARLMVSAVEAAAGGVRALIPWRRREWPSNTALHVFHGEQQDVVFNVMLVADGREAAEVLIDTRHGAGEYDLYYLPHSSRWEAYDARDDMHGTRYDAYSGCLLPSWCERFASREDLPRAHVFDLQARTHRDRPDSMARSATRAEIAAHLRSAAAAAHIVAVEGINSLTPPWLLFPESRQYPLKSNCELPERWATATPSRSLSSTARPGESYVWQIGVYAASDADVAVLSAEVQAATWRFGSSRSSLLPFNVSSLGFHAFNLGGIGHDGKPMTIEPNVRSGCARSLWFGLDVPDAPAAADDDHEAPTLEVSMKLLLRARAADSVAAAAASRLHERADLFYGTRSVRFDLRLSVRGARLEDKGDSRRWRLSRLRWLDSTRGAEPAVPYPFTPVVAMSAAEDELLMRNRSSNLNWAAKAAVGAVQTALKRALLQTVSVATGSAEYKSSRAIAGESTLSLVLKARMGTLHIGEHGLPLQIFAGMASGKTVEEESGSGGYHAILSMPMRFVVRAGKSRDGNEREMSWTLLQPAVITDKTDERIKWAASLGSVTAAGSSFYVRDGATSSGSKSHGGSGLTMDVVGEWWFDSSCTIRVTLTNGANARHSIELSEGELLVPWDKASVGRYLMGLGAAGDHLSNAAPIKWSWRAGLGNYMVWIGDVHAGMRLRLVGDAPAFESAQHILSQSDLPSSWHNGGNGGVYVSTEGLVRAFSGSRQLAPGESITFAFELLLTPCKPLDPPSHWKQRYYQVGYPTAASVEPEVVAATGATILNIHQGVDGLLNPHINYPFDKRTTSHLSAYTETAHALGLRVKAYYTVRELSNHADELWVLRSLADEVLADGNGGGDSWANEQLVNGFAACWQTPLSDGDFDSALCTKGISRWVNYYVEGLTRLLRPPVNLDGIYYDGIGFGVHTMRRVRRVLQAEKGMGNGLIDLHCGNMQRGKVRRHDWPRPLGHRSQRNRASAGADAHPAVDQGRHA